MSDASVTASPSTCSGLAYSSVIGRHSVRVTSGVWRNSGFSSLAIPKSKQPGYSVFGNQNIAGLQIAVNHQVPMSVSDGGADAKDNCKRERAESCSEPQYSSMGTPST